MKYPTSALQDRKWLGLEISDYRTLVEQVMSNKLRKVNSREIVEISLMNNTFLREYRGFIRRHSKYKHSMIYKELDRRITDKIQSRMGKIKPKGK